MKIPAFLRKHISVFLHVIIWGIVFLLPYLTDVRHTQPRPQINSAQDAEFLQLNLYTLFCLAAVFYLNAYLLIPKLFNRKKYWQYFLSVLLVFCAVMLLHSLLFKIIISSVPFNFIRSVRFTFPAFLMTMAVSIAFRMIVDKIKSDRHNMQKNQENLKTELAFLRSQISPHFLMNVLNNIVALNRLKSPDLEPTLIKLSGLMQYMLYNTDEDKLSLKEEADFLKSYIDIQQQRFGSKVNIIFTIDIAREQAEIEPMLLIPFVENAFKHGIGMIENPEILIQFTSNENGELLFIVQNKYDPASVQIKDKTSGIGLGNVKRRLNILYGDKHFLSIKNENNLFIVTLKLKLN